MKKFLRWYFDNVFSSLKRYRKWRGGTWYKVIDKEAANGMAGQYAYWSRTAPSGWSLIAKEEYAN